MNDVRRLLEPSALSRVPPNRLGAVAGRQLAAQRAAIAVDDVDAAGDHDVRFHDALVAESANVPMRILAQALIASTGQAARAVYASPEVRKRAVALLANHQATASRHAFGPDKQGTAPDGPSPAGSQPAIPSPWIA